MLRILLLILIGYGGNYQPAYRMKQPSKQVTKPVETGECVQLPVQKSIIEP